MAKSPSVSSIDHPVLLSVDIGNTRLKWALFEGREICGTGALVPEFDAEWSPLLRLPAPRTVAVASVGPVEWLERFCGVAADVWGRPPVIVRTGTRYAGLRNGYEIPGRLGVDRWAAMVAAWDRCGGPVCVVDAGSAVTIDLVDGSGRHRGGLIAPGIAMMRDSLLHGTRDVVVNPDFDNGLQEWPRDTKTGVEYGCHHAVASLIAGVVARWRSEVHAPTCLLTGGDAERLSGLIDTSCRLEPHLVLEGIATLAEAEAEDLT